MFLTLLVLAAMAWPPILESPSSAGLRGRCHEAF
jgi:hypothetical protein